MDNQLTQAEREAMQAAIEGCIDRALVERPCQEAERGESVDPDVTMAACFRAGREYGWLAHREYATGLIDDPKGQENQDMDHNWDTEPVEDVTYTPSGHGTYTPPEHYDRPWIIRMCCGCKIPNCKALLIDLGEGPTEYVHIDTHEGQCQSDYVRGITVGSQADGPRVGKGRRIEVVPIDGTGMNGKTELEQSLARERELAEAIHRLNIDWEGAAHDCGDTKCQGDCRYVQEVQAALDRVLGTKRLPDAARAALTGQGEQACGACGAPAGYPAAGPCPIHPVPVEQPRESDEQKIRRISDEVSRRHRGCYFSPDEVREVIGNAHDSTGVPQADEEIRAAAALPVEGEAREAEPSDAEIVNAIAGRLSLANAPEHLERAVTELLELASLMESRAVPVEREHEVSRDLDIEAAKAVLKRLGMSWEPDCSVPAAIAKLGMQIDILRQREHEVAPTSYDPQAAMRAVLHAYGRVRDGQWVKGAATHVFAELLTELQNAGWWLTRREHEVADAEAIDAAIDAFENAPPYDGALAPTLPTVKR